MRLRALAPAKVNLCLFLGQPRADGRHELVTVFESLSLADELSLEIHTARSDKVSCPGLEGLNLVESALSGLRANGWNAPPVHVAIRKRIPVAAGMGGGSADAAAMLRLAQALAPLPEEKIEALARRLGADVPSQLVPGLALGTGAGELVERRAPLAEHAFVIVPQRYALSTAEVFQAADGLGLARATAQQRDLLTQVAGALRPGERMSPLLVTNDLEKAALALRPELSQTLDAIHAAHADHAMVCGSGPTVAGLYWGPDARARSERAAHELAHRYPGACSAVPVESDFGRPQTR